MDILLLLICVSSLYLGDVNTQATTVQPSSQPARIEGPATFVTDGTRELTLTYHTNTTVSGNYFCILSGPRTCPEQVDNTCTFRPTLEDDGKSVICTIQSSSFEVLSRASYNINLSYPPPSSPNIILPSHTTQPLKQGDVIMCSVSGGKPRVTSLTFHCENTDLADQEDDVSDDGSTVSSNITVDTSTATEQDMTCSCSAFWEPEPGLYQNTADMTFELARYKAVVRNFTVNGRTTTTVSQGEGTRVTFSCEATGRPPPVVSLHRRGSDIAHGLPYTLTAPRCEDLGTYICQADNGFPNPDHRAVQLFVRCAPRLSEALFESSKVYNLTQTGKSFILLGYPTPLIAARLTGNDVAEPTSHDDGKLRLNCQRNDFPEYLVNCSLTPVQGQAVDGTVYNVTIENELGTITLQFRVTLAELEPNGNENLSSGAIAGVVLGTLLLVALLVFTVIIVKRSRSMKSCRKTDEQLNDATQFAAETQDLQPVAGLRGSRQQRQQQEHQPQSTSIQSQEHGTVTSENTTETHTYINEGNTYDVLQRNQQDDGRTYATLMTSANRRHPAGVSSTSGTGDYEIP